MATPLKSVSFEVFGKVQGVFFRKHTQSEAKKLGLTGWVQNTQGGTVIGCIEGPEDKIKIMKIWLEKTGSPESHIDKCVFSNEKIVDKPSFSSFDIRH
ncbi:acylphosphatase-2-like isoform X2 [Physella acuta]|uniref:acylphosphatase-2-like isoform X2 n=1 Tax=Physella acuta TaxID=109671 RepID=UPI0027DE2D2D|nr:acylphosphatase-2-like isoform X2 [Physella acuta]